MSFEPPARLSEGRYGPTTRSEMQLYLSSWCATLPPASTAVPRAASGVRDVLLPSLLPLLAVLCGTNGSELNIGTPSAQYAYAQSHRQALSRRGEAPCVDPYTTRLLLTTNTNEKRTRPLTVDPNQIEQKITRKTTTTTTTAAAQAGWRGRGSSRRASPMGAQARAAVEKGQENKEVGEIGIYLTHVF